jgi:DNA invertase Pin-like site-specific DNA recombinase
MSTDQQEDSPVRQRAEIEAMTEEGGYQILKWYEDHGLTGTKSKNRPQFQQLLKDAGQVGDFEAILMHEQSRFGRETMLPFAGHLNNLHEAGVTLVTRKGKISPDDIG